MTTTTTNNAQTTNLALVPHSEGEQSVAQFLEGLPQELARIFTLVDERKTYAQEEFSALRTIQSQRFEELLGKMTHFHHACTSTLGVMLHQAELLGLHQYAPGGPFTLFEWATRNHIGMTRATFEQAYELGKALPILTELGVPQAVIESPQFTPYKANLVLRQARDLGRQKKPIFERLVAERLEETGEEELSPEEEQALEKEAYEEVLVSARATVIDMVTNQSDDDLKRAGARADGQKDRVPLVIKNITYRRLKGDEEGLGILSGNVEGFISDEQVEALREGKYFLSFGWGHEEGKLNARGLGERIEEQIAEELDAIDSTS